MAFSTPTISRFQSLGASGGTTGGLDTTGADLVVVAVSSTQGGNNPSLSDNKSNTWTALTRYTDAGRDISVKLFYCVAPTVGSGHTFTVSGADMYCSAAVVGLVGSAASTPFDQENGASGTGTSLSPGSVTPSENNEIVLSVINLNPANTASINGGFTILGYVTLVPGVSLGIALAYLIQTSAAAANPTWSWTGSVGAIATSATFKAAAGGGGPAVPVFVHHRKMQGIA